MSEPLTLTFAEIEFLLNANPGQADAVRAQLRLTADEARTVLASGVASLLVRNLCRDENGTVVPGPELIAVSAGLSTFTLRLEAIGWSPERTTAWHVFGGPDASVALIPEGYGRFTVVAANEKEPVDALAVRILDSIVGAPGSGMIIRVSTGADAVATGPSPKGVAIAVDEQGTWLVSDSADSPDRGRPASRAIAVERLAAVLGSQPVGAAR